MSADNWAVCPRCKHRALLKFEEDGAAVQALYGKVPIEEFDAARASLAMEDVGYTFREDYEFYGADEGEIQAAYEGGCTRCGLTVSLRASKTFWTPNHMDAHVRAAGAE